VETFLIKQLNTLCDAAVNEIAAAQDSVSLAQVRIKFLGKKGEMTQILKSMGTLSPAARPAMGEHANTCRAELETLLKTRADALKTQETATRLAAEAIDVTLPGKPRTMGHAHPISAVIARVTDVMLGMGFSVAEGPEVEFDRYVFEALNIPKGHPARDTQDSFYITDDILLRSQTSSVQIRVMEKQKPPIRIISPGRVYRADAVDATHSPLFHQIEGLVVDKGVTMADLKGTLEYLATQLFGANAKARFRPHHFPFTEPSCEVDFSCFRCGGKGCPMCKGEGWIELLGAGMVHPKVLQNCGIDAEVYSGFAFGWGVERLAMLLYQIDDLRLLYENDVRFLKQF
jgi:phenylalanyl-tRNA synthetase alpha chain